MVTLNQFFLDGQPDLATHIKTALAEQHLDVTGGSDGMLAWRMMPKAIAGQLSSLLNIGFGDILIGAWNKSYALREQLQKSAKAPEKDFFLELVEHTIKSTHDPYIALLKNGREIGRLPFSISLELVLQGAVLRIRDGAVREVQTGQIKCKGAVKLAGATLIEKQLSPVNVPGTFEVGAEPISLRLSA
jgi:hypothetical protein